jgi:hypothetical protein
LRESVNGRRGGEDNAEVSVIAAMPRASTLMRSYLSSHHLACAKFFAAETARIERAFIPGPGVSRLRQDHRAFSIGAVLSSAAFLESAINELFKDAFEDYRAYLPRMSKDSVALLKGTYRKGWRPGTLEKYATAWLLIRRRPLERSTKVYSQAHLTLRLRNALHHFEPDTLGETVPQLPLERELRGKFAANQMMAGMGNPYFPDHCLGAGCAEWAWRSCKAFADYFFKGVRIKANYRRLGL